MASRKWIIYGITIGCISACHAEQLPLWELGIGVAAISFPDYRGAKAQHSYLLPIPYAEYRGDFLQVDRDKVRGLFFKSERFELDVSVNASVPVRSDKNEVRRGMPNLDPTFELGPSLNFLLTPGANRNRLTLKLPVRAVIASDFRSTQNAGTLFQPQLNFDVGLGGGWNLGLVTSVLFGDRRNHAYFYGVAQPFATPSRPAYAAHGGYAGTQVIAATSKRFKQFWVASFIKYDNVSSAVFADSPLVERRHNVAFGASIAWIFKQSKQLVEAKKN